MIPQRIPQLPDINDPQFRVELERHLNELNETVHLLLQFLSPAIENNKDTPNSILDSLE